MRPLAISAFAESWGTAVLIMFQIRDCSVRLNQGLLHVQSVNAKSGYMGMWHTFQRSTQPTALSSQERTLGGEGEANRPHGLGKSMNPAGMLLEWEGGLHVDLPGGIPGGGDTGLVRGGAPRRMRDDGMSKVKTESSTENGKGTILKALKTSVDLKGTWTTMASVVRLASTNGK